MTPEQFLFTFVAAIGMGVAASGITALGSADKWNWKQFLYTVGTSIFGTFAILQGADFAKDGVTFDNFFTFAMEVSGAMFWTNKLVKTAVRLAPAVASKTPGRP